MLARHHKNALAPALSLSRKLFCSSSSTSYLPLGTTRHKSNLALTQPATMARHPSLQQSRPVHATSYVGHAVPA